jgi:hypothetical protein
MSIENQKIIKKILRNFAIDLLNQNFKDKDTVRDVFDFVDAWIGDRTFLYTKRGKSSPTYQNKNKNIYEKNK